MSKLRDLSKKARQIGELSDPFEEREYDRNQRKWVARQKRSITIEVGHVSHIVTVSAEDKEEALSKLIKRGAEIKKEREKSCKPKKRRG